MILNKLQKQKIVTIGKKQAAEYIVELKKCPLMTTFPHNEFKANRKNMKLCRYKGVLCCDTTRVVLESGIFVHANEVSLGGLKLILAQGPIQNTIDEFWDSVIEKKVLQIFMLCKFVEEDKAKCYEYYPHNTAEMNTEKYEIVQAMQHKICFGGRSDIIKTTLRINPKGSRMIHYVDHYCYTAWPDHSIPNDTEELLYFVELIIKNPYVVSLIHCSAGIGRTGTLAAAAFSVHLFENHKFHDIYTILYQLRKQRCQSIQTAKQYFFVHLLFVQLVKTRTKFNVATIIDQMKKQLPLIAD